MPLKKRVIPALFLQNGQIVRSEKFTKFKILGNPIDQLKRLSDWNADELMYIDITRTGGHDPLRLDHKNSIIGGLLDILKAIAEHAIMPLTFGGNIKHIEQVDALIDNGADKVLVNTGLIYNIKLSYEVARKYGSQAMVGGIDIIKDTVMYDHGRTHYFISPKKYAQILESEGCGEILVNSIDRDGTGKGYELEIISQIADSVKIPVVAMGGIRMWNQLVPALKSNISAVAVGNVFNFVENAYLECKKYLKEEGMNVR